MNKSIVSPFKREEWSTVRTVFAFQLCIHSLSSGNRIYIFLEAPNTPRSTFQLGKWTQSVFPQLWSLAEYQERDLCLQTWGWDLPYAEMLLERKAKTGKIDLKVGIHDSVWTLGPWCLSCDCFYSIEPINIIPFDWLHKIVKVTFGSLTTEQS